MLLCGNIKVNDISEDSEIVLKELGFGVTVQYFFSMEENKHVANDIVFFLIKSVNMHVGLCRPLGSLAFQSCGTIPSQSHRLKMELGGLARVTPTSTREIRDV